MTSDFPAMRSRLTKIFGLSAGASDDAILAKSAAFRARFAQRLGLSADATNDQVFAALDKALAVSEVERAAALAGWGGARAVVADRSPIPAELAELARRAGWAS